MSQELSRSIQSLGTQLRCTLRTKHKSSRFSFLSIIIRSSKTQIESKSQRQARALQDLPRTHLTGSNTEPVHSFHYTMPKTAALSIAFPQNSETTASIESPRSPPVDSGIEDYYKLSQPTQSPASSPRASRSFFSSFTGGKQNKGKGIEQPSLKIPSTPSSGQSTPTATHPPSHMSSESQVNLPDTSSISEGKTSHHWYLRKWIPG